MNATQAKTTHTCSCGRSFANEQILKYHQRVSKHEAPEGAAAPTTSMSEILAKHDAAAQEVVVVAPVAAPSPAELAEQAYLQAVEVLMAKRAEQEAYERNQAAVRAVGEFVEKAGEMAGQGCQVAGRAVTSAVATGRLLASKLLVVMFIVLATAGVITAGMGLGSLVASVSGTGVAQAVSPAGTVAQI